MIHSIYTLAPLYVSLVTQEMYDGQAMFHLRLPTWLICRIKSRAEEVGQTPSAEIRRVLVQAYGDKNWGPEEAIPRPNELRER